MTTGRINQVKMELVTSHFRRETLGHHSEEGFLIKYLEVRRSEYSDLLHEIFDEPPITTVFRGRKMRIVLSIEHVIAIHCISMHKKHFCGAVYNNCCKTRSAGVRTYAEP